MFRNCIDIACLNRLKGFSFGRRERCGMSPKKPLKFLIQLHKPIYFKNLRFVTKEMTMKKVVLCLALLVGAAGCGSSGSQSKGVEPQTDIDQLFALPDNVTANGDNIYGVWFRASGTQENREQIRIAITQEQFIFAKSCFKGAGDQDLIGKIVVAVNARVDEKGSVLHLEGQAADENSGCAIRLHSGKARFTIKSNGQILELTLPGSKEKMALKRIADSVPTLSLEDNG